MENRPARHVVRIITLGRFLVEVDGRPLEFRTKAQRKPLELLKLVIALGGVSAAVETLTEAIWPESEGDNAYNAFGTTLGRLRALIGKDVLHLSDGRLSLDPHQCRVDALEFEQASNAAARALALGDGDTAWTHLQAALALYQGPFLEGEFDPPQILSARDKLHSLLMRQVEELGALLDRSDQAERAVSLYHQALELDDLAEPLYQRLMAIFLREGRLAEGIAAYQRCRQILQARLGVDPSPETERAYQSILGAQGVQSPVAKRPSDSLQEQAPEPPSHTTSPPPPAAVSQSSGGRRQATVLFSDLSGYTALNEKLDPEEVDEIMRRFKTEAVAVVERHGGIVNQFVGDEVLAVFGVVTAYEDDPRRAVRAALDLHRMVRQISLEFEQKIVVPLRSHTGISSGLIVAQLRDDRDGQYSIVGDAVNVGAHLAALAKADEILISAETYRYAEPYFNTEVLQPFSLKGKTHPVQAYRVTGESAVATRIDASEQRGFTAFTGRAWELELLRLNLAKAAVGDGQFVTVVGEAGIGKSRLAYQFHHGLDPHRFAVLEGRCQSYGSATPYLPFINALRRALNLLERETPAQLLDKTVTRVLAIDKALERTLPYCLHLLSIPSEAYPVPKRLTGPDLAIAIQEALCAIFTLLAQSQPMVLILEDWHWADDASNNALKTLLGVIASTPLLVVVLYRPEFVPDWGHHSHHTSLVLRALDPGHSESIVKAALGLDALPMGLAARIHARTGGNPFFIEEVCEELREKGSLIVRGGQWTLPLEQISLPDTVQAVLQARVDRLDVPVRDILGLAAVIGREFTRGILERISTDTTRIPSALEELKSLELIQQIRVVPEATYLFKHSLTQEVVYNTLLRKERKVLHGRVARAIEEFHPERLEEQVELLAHHYANGDDPDKAVAYLELAGNRAAHIFSRRDARTHFEAALDVLNARPPTEAVRRHVIALCFKWAEVAFYTPSVDGLHMIEAALAHAQALGDRNLEAQLAYWVGRMNHILGNLKLSLEQVRHCADTARDLGDETLLRRAEALIGRTCLMTCEHAQGMALLHAAIPRLEQLGELDEAAYCNTFLGLMHAWRGDFDASEPFFNRALEIAHTMGNPAREAMNFGDWGYALWLRGDLAQAEAVGSLAEPLAAKIGDTFSWIEGIYTKLWCRIDRGDPEPGIPQLEEFTRSIQAHHGSWSFMAHNLAVLAEFNARAGNRTAAADFAAQALEQSRHGETWAIPIIQRTLGRVAALQTPPDWAAAAALLQQSIAQATDLGLRPDTAHGYLAYAETLLRKGDPEPAHRHAAQARDLYHAMGMTFWHAKAQELLRGLPVNASQP